MVHIVHGKADERHAEDERDHVRTREECEERACGHEKRHAHRDEQLRHEPPRTEEHPSEQRHQNDRYHGKEVDFTFRAGCGTRRVEHRPAAPYLREAGGEGAVDALCAKHDLLRFLKREVAALHQQEVAVSAFANRISVLERPAGGEVRLHGHRIVRGEQERIVLHGEERRHRSEEARSGGVGHVLELACAEQLARFGGDESARARGEIAQRLLKIDCCVEFELLG